MSAQEKITRGKRFVRDQRTAVLLVFIASLLWGSAFHAIKRSYVLLGVSPGDLQVPLAFAGIRFLLAGIVLAALGAIRGSSSLKNCRRLRFVIVLGVVQTFLQYAAFYVGMGLTTGIKAAIIVASGSFFLALFSPLVYRNDRLGGVKIVALLVGFAGVVLAQLTQPRAQAGSGQWLGDFMILLTALCSAAASLLSKRLVQSVPPILLNGVQLMVGAVLLLVVAALPGIPTTGEWSPELIGWTIYLAFITAVAFSLYYVVVKHHSLTRVAAYRFLIPLCGVIESALLIPGESLDGQLFLAASLVILGIWIVNRPSHGEDG